MLFLAAGGTVLTTITKRIVRLTLDPVVRFHALNYYAFYQGMYYIVVDKPLMWKRVRDLLYFILCLRINSPST